MTTRAAGNGSVAITVRESVDYLRGRIPEVPEVLLVLGSGLGPLADALEDSVRIPYQDIPGFPPPAVEGHEGVLVAGRLEGVPCIALRGRYHLYEGHSPATVVLPVRVAAALGARVMLATNAAGALSRRLSPGDLMILDDHIDLQWHSPLIGPALEGEPRFPDMSRPYDPAFQMAAARVAIELGLRASRGVYCGVLGPSYETPAEVRMLQKLGGDAVGMSTVPEVITARAAGLRVLGLSLMTNPAAGLFPAPLRHQDVVEAAKSSRDSFEALVRGVLPELVVAPSSTDTDQM